MKTTLVGLALVLMASGAGCSRPADAPPPATAAEAPAADARPAQAPPAPAASQVPAPPLAPEPANAVVSPPVPVAKYHEVTLPAGTKIGVRLNGMVSSDTSKVEDAVDVTVIQAVTINEAEVIPAGARMKGIVSAVAAAGKVKGRASLSLDFTTLEMTGETYPISAHVSQAAPATKGADAKKVGIPAAGGALIGGLLGGKQGAAAGAAVGGGAGAAVVLSTPGKPVAFPKGLVLSLRLAKPVTIRVPTSK